MTDRIKRMTESILRKSMYPEAVPVEYDRHDLMLPDMLLTATHLSEYMLAQTVAIGDDTWLVGHFLFDGVDVPSEIFTHLGFRRFGELMEAYYHKPLDNLGTLEHQHAAADFGDVIEHGIEGKLTKIEQSLEVHKNEPEKVEFLTACKILCHGILAWEAKCADACREKAATEQNTHRRAELLTMAMNLDRVPRKPAESFYEAVQCVYFCFNFLPDSLATLDRYLRRFYQADKAIGSLTDADAKALLQELFLRVQSFTPLSSPCFTRGGQSHFCVGGYDAEGHDTTDEFTLLVLESLMELPLYIPQVSFRWTPDTPSEVFYRVMDMERHDPNKRIAIVNDAPRIQGFMENCGISREDAVNYTMVGCNEPMLVGGMWYEGMQSNAARSLDRTLFAHRAEIENAADFEDFYTVYRNELYNDLAAMIRMSDGFNIGRAKDVDILSSLFLKGCIESGVSCTKGGAHALTGITIVGLVTVLDSLAVIKQFVFDEKRVTFRTLLDALQSDWVGFEALRMEIIKEGKFFGNGDASTDALLRRFDRDLRDYLIDKTNLFGKRFLVGNIIGYRQHHVWFGEGIRATPDGRKAGEPLTYGLSQLSGRDRNGLTALLASVASFDETCICVGPSVTNINLDSTLVKDDRNFAKLVTLLETYFRLGGLQLQLNCVSAEELRAAQRTPEAYSSLRVRVSGFSDYFNNLNQPLQEEIIKRTEIRS